MLKGDSAHQDEAGDNEVQKRGSANAEYQPAKMNYPKPCPDPCRIRQEHLQKRRHKHCSPNRRGDSPLRRWHLHLEKVATPCWPPDCVPQFVASLFYAGLGNQFPKRNGGNFLPLPFPQGIILPRNLVTAVHSHMRRPNAGNRRDWKITLERRLSRLARAWLWPLPTSVLTGFRG